MHCYTYAPQNYNLYIYIIVLRVGVMPLPTLTGVQHKEGRIGDIRDYCRGGFP